MIPLRITPSLEQRHEGDRDNKFDANRHRRERAGRFEYQKKLRNLLNQGVLGEVGTSTSAAFISSSTSAFFPIQEPRRELADPSTQGHVHYEESPHGTSTSLATTSSLKTSEVKTSNQKQKDTVTNHSALAASTTAAAQLARTRTALFDSSWRQVFCVTGRDRQVAADHFVTCDFRRMRPGDAQYACLLDTKAKILDTAIAVKKESEIFLVLEGKDGAQTFDYLANYVTYLRQTGLDVALGSALHNQIAGIEDVHLDTQAGRSGRTQVVPGKKNGSTAVVELVGPKAARAVATTLRALEMTGRLRFVLEHRAAKPKWSEKATDSVKAAASLASTDQNPCSSKTTPAASSAQHEHINRIDWDSFKQMPVNSCVTLKVTPQDLDMEAMEAAGTTILEYLLNSDELRDLHICRTPAITGERGFLVFGSDSAVKEFAAAALENSTNSGTTSSGSSTTNGTSTIDVELEGDDESSSRHCIYTTTSPRRSNSPVPSTTTTAHEFSQDTNKSSSPGNLSHEQQGDQIHICSAAGDEKVFLAPYDAYDILRVEAGFPRTGVDFRAGMVTPVYASLSWTIAQSKLRNHTLFGWQRLFNDLAKGPRFRRVGVICEPGAFVSPGCVLFSADTGIQRVIVGKVASVVYSPHLGTRIGISYVRPEYAERGRRVLANFLFDLPARKMKPDRLRFLLKQREHRTNYRRLVPLRIADLPFIREADADARSGEHQREHQNFSCENRN
ncbi:unnamed protein product [Amoebophrya sp. A25]|nr:unnamed protein product [Amoebophrya sp. A25]|eukprot:GSA25T00026168001.1